MGDQLLSLLHILPFVFFLETKIDWLELQRHV